MSAPFLIVGLGNPGAEYSSTRHNVGFLVVDALAKRLGVSTFSQKFHGEIAQSQVGSEKVFLLKPLTYMNRSGLCVAEAAGFYKIPPAQVLVVYDDLDLEPGFLRIRLSGSSGGHNGMESVIESLGTDAFPRFRIGIGRPRSGAGKDYVLQRIPKKEMPLYEDTILKTCEALEAAVKEGVQKAMNQFNKKREVSDGT